MKDEVSRTVVWPAKLVANSHCQLIGCFRLKSMQLEAVQWLWWAFTSISPFRIYWYKLCTIHLYLKTQTSCTSNCMKTKFNLILKNKSHRNKKQNMLVALISQLTSHCQQHLQCLSCCWISGGMLIWHQLMLIRFNLISQYTDQKMLMWNFNWGIPVVPSDHVVSHLNSCPPMKSSFVLLLYLAKTKIVALIQNKF